MTVPTYGVMWSAPDRFLLYRADWDGQRWIDQSMEELQPSEKYELRLRAELEGFVAVARDRATPDVLDLWIAHVAGEPSGAAYVNVTGTIAFGGPADIARLAEEWREASLSAQSTHRDVTYFPSRRAPVVVTHGISTAKTPDGKEIYRQWGVALRDMPRTGQSVRIDVDTPDLNAFDNIVEFLQQAILDVTLTELEATA